MTDEQTHLNEIREWSKFADTPMRKAAKWALSEIERLTEENADLKTKLDRESTDELTKTIAAMSIINVEKEAEIKRLTTQIVNMQSRIDSSTQKLMMRAWVTRDLVDE